MDRFFRYICAACLSFLLFFQCSCTKSGSKKADDSINMPVTIAGSPIRGIVPVCSISHRINSPQNRNEHKVICSAVNRTEAGDREINNPEQFHFTWEKPQVVAGISILASTCHETESGAVNDCDVTLSSAGTALVTFTLKSSKKDGSGEQTASDEVSLPTGGRSIGFALSAGRRISPGQAISRHNAISTRNALAPFERAGNAIGVQPLSIPVDEARIPFNNSVTSNVCNLNGVTYALSRVDLFAIENGKIKRVAGRRGGLLSHSDGPLADPGDVDLQGRTVLVCVPPTQANPTHRLLVFGATNANIRVPTKPSEFQYRPFVIEYRETGEAIYRNLSIQGVAQDSPDRFLNDLAGATLAPDGNIYLIDMNAKARNADANDLVRLPAPRILKFSDNTLSVHVQVYSAPAKDLCNETERSGSCGKRFLGGIVGDQGGNLYVSAEGYDAVWRVNAQKQICRMAGNSQFDDASVPQMTLCNHLPPLTLQESKLRAPGGLALLSDGSLLISTNFLTTGTSPELGGAILRVGTNVVEYAYDFQVGRTGLPSYDSKKDERTVTIENPPTRNLPPNQLSLLSLGGDRFQISVVGGTLYEVAFQNSKAKTLTMISFGVRTTVNEGDTFETGGTDPNARFADATELLIDSPTSFLMSESNTNRILRIHELGSGKVRVSVVAGTHHTDRPDEDENASPKSIALGKLGALALGNDGSIYVSEMGSRANREAFMHGYSVARVAPPSQSFPDGKFDRIAGGRGIGVYLFDPVTKTLRNGPPVSEAYPKPTKRAVEGLSAKELFLRTPGSIAVTPSGTIFVSDYHSRKIANLGLILALRPQTNGDYLTHVAVHPGQLPDLGNAEDNPLQFSVLSDGSFLIANQNAQRGGEILLVSGENEAISIAGKRFETGKGLISLGEKKPALDVSFNPAVFKEERHNSWLIVDRQWRLLRMTKDGPNGAFMIEAIYDRQADLTKCGLADVPISATDADALLRTSLMRICVPIITAVAGRNRCSEGENLARLIIGAGWDPSASVGTMVSATYSCPRTTP